MPWPLPLACSSALQMKCSSWSFSNEAAIRKQQQEHSQEMESCKMFPLWCLDQRCSLLSRVFVVGASVRSHVVMVCAWQPPKWTHASEQLKKSCTEQCKEVMQSTICLGCSIHHESAHEIHHGTSLESRRCFFRFCWRHPKECISQWVSKQLVSLVGKFLSWTRVFLVFALKEVCALMTPDNKDQIKWQTNTAAHLKTLLANLATCVIHQLSFHDNSTHPVIFWHTFPAFWFLATCPVFRVLFDNTRLANRHQQLFEMRVNRESIVVSVKKVIFLVFVVVNNKCLFSITSWHKKCCDLFCIVISPNWQPWQSLLRHTRHIQINPVNPLCCT